jgi:hypothetical protein
MCYIICVTSQNGAHTNKTSTVTSYIYTHWDCPVEICHSLTLRSAGLQPPKRENTALQLYILAQTTKATIYMYIYRQCHYLYTNTDKMYTNYSMEKTAYIFVYNVYIYTYKMSLPIHGQTLQNNFNSTSTIFSLREERSLSAWYIPKWAWRGPDSRNSLGIPPSLLLPRSLNLQNTTVTMVTKPV